METAEVELGTATYLRGSAEAQLFAMGTPGEYYSDTIHTIAIKTRETEFGSIVEPIPVYKSYPARALPINGYRYSQQQIISVPYVPDEAIPTTSKYIPSPPKKEPSDSEKLSRTPPKKKWIKDYMGKSAHIA